MQDLITSLTVRFSLCVLLSYLAWKQADVISLVFSSLVFGLALSGPILDLVSNIKGILSGLAYSKINGRYYQFQNIAINIIEDEMHQRWLSLPDVRKVIDGFPRDSVVVKLYPDEFMIDKKIGVSRIGAKALINYLQNSSNVNSMKFKLWIEREVNFPRKKAQY